ncbi:MAG: hypothetical protein OEW79_03560 [Betaproteobacteria bacterium]|jgi:hypothetical protein|nr:hypothetical protein [Betaproteobacteria bacterium]MDH4293489.1 hypothetical protein [Betaproteobacteria bacterium]MDH5341894.1 hypothetical protein [Betaproteobacteria bacterium]
MPDAMMMTVTRVLAGTLIAVVLAACGTHGKPRQFNLAGYSAAYKNGHADGCKSVSGSMHRDSQRYKSDADYMMGWNDGHSVCK